MAIKYATDETYAELVKEGVVLVDFFGKTCGPCKLLAVVLEELDDEFPFINIVKVDVEECPKTSEQFKINGIPDLYYYKDGQVVTHETGFGSKDMVLDTLAKILY
ncbi:MAG: thioredoxin family protein [Butyrivibrio sp.]|nr:thioredoxin family protein [Butyrivibrio sp.]